MLTYDLTVVCKYHSYNLLKFRELSAFQNTKRYASNFFQTPFWRYFLLFSTFLAFHVYFKTLGSIFYLSSTSRMSFNCFCNSWRHLTSFAESGVIFYNSGRQFFTPDWVVIFVTYGVILFFRNTSSNIIIFYFCNSCSTLCFTFFLQLMKLSFFAEKSLKFLYFCYSSSSFSYSRRTCFTFQFLEYSISILEIRFCINFFNYKSFQFIF